MATFANGIVQVTSSIGSVSAMIWNPGYQGTTTFGSLGSVPSNAVLNGLVIANTGSSPLYIGSGSVSASTTTGVQVPAGGQVLLENYSGTGAAAGTIWANTSNNVLTSSAQVGLPSVVSVI